MSAVEDKLSKSCDTFGEVLNRAVRDCAHADLVMMRFHLEGMRQITDAIVSAYPEEASRWKALVSEFETMYEVLECRFRHTGV